MTNGPSHANKMEDSTGIQENSSPLLIYCANHQFCNHLCKCTFPLSNVHTKRWNRTDSKLGRWIEWVNTRNIICSIRWRGGRGEERMYNTCENIICKMLLVDVCIILFELSYTTTMMTNVWLGSIFRYVPFFLYPTETFQSSYSRLILQWQIISFELYLYT